MKTKLSLLALLAQFYVLAASAYDFTTGGVYYNITKAPSGSELGTVSVASGTDKYTGTVTIPASVTYSGKTYIVTSIGSSAFEYCHSLTSVTIGNSVTSIGDDAFFGCYSLASVTIPNSVTSIGGRAFYNCIGLTSIKVESGNVTYDSRGNCNAIIETGTNKLIIGCMSTKIPNSVTSIGEWAIAGCNGLTSVTIPNSVTSIGSYAFYNCRGLTSVTIPESVTNIGDGAFTACSDLTSLKVEEGNTTYDSRNDCNAIIETATNTLITGCMNTIITNSVTSIGRRAFQGCSDLTSVTLPNDVTSIGIYAFANCSGLTNVYCYAENVPETDSKAFSGSSIASATLYVPEGSVESYKATEPWSGFGTITSITDNDDDIEDMRKQLMDLTNAVAERLYEVESQLRACATEDEAPELYNEITDCEDLLYLITYQIYEATTKEELVACLKQIEYLHSYISELQEEIEELMNGITFSALTIEGVNMVFKILDKVEKTVQVGLGSEHGVAISQQKGGNVTIPAEVEGYKVIAIGYNAFYNCYNMASITIPKSITRIDGYAFEYCSSLTSVTIPNSVTDIGNNAFYECSSLTSATIPNSVNNIDLFGRCYKLTSIVIPNSVTSIGYRSFFICESLSSVTIPSSVTTIDKEAFDGCSSLADVYCFAEEVPETADDAFTSSSFSSATLHVPASSIEQYQSTAPWSGFGSIVPLETDVFTAKTKEGVTMTFKVLDKEEMTCQVGNGEEASVNVATTGQVTIPEIAKGYKVTAIGDKGFYNCSKLTHIWLHEGIERIGVLAFYGCTSLQVLDLPPSIVYISDDAFDGCSNLQVNIPSEIIGNLTYNPSPGSGVVISIIPPSGHSQEQMNEMKRIFIPKPVTSIGERSFTGCKSVEVIEVDAENPVFDSRNNCNAIIRTADNTLLFGCQNTVIPETVTAINSYAFEGHSNLNSISIPNGITSIGEAAFSGCTALMTITSHISEPFAISDDTFSDETYQNATLTVPVGTKELYQTAAGWKNFFNIVENELQNGDTFTAKTAEGVEIAFTVISVSDKTCQISSPAIDKATTGSITIPRTVQGYTVTSIGYKAFQSCRGLTSIIIPNSVTSIGSSAFEYCSGLTSVTIPNSVTSIGRDAFGYCSGLTFVTIPNSVTSIGESAFEYCSGLTSVTIPNSVTSIGMSAFEGCSGLTSIIIPNSVTSIGRAAFLFCGGLTSVTIPNSVTSIGDFAFRDCGGLTSVTIPNSVTSIGMSAFCGCSGLTSFTIPESVTSISDGVLSGCTSLTSVTIPNSVTSICGYAFSGCSGLTSVTIPNSVTSIKTRAFKGCTGLIDVYCYAEQVPNTYSDIFVNSPIATATLHVSESSIEQYRAATPWKYFGNIVAIEEETKKCATPTIGYAYGKLTFKCETEDVAFIYDIKDDDIKYGSGNDISLSVAYHISVYATKGGFEDSDVATATLCWVDQQPEAEGLTDEDAILEMKAMPVLIQNHEGVLTISGTEEGAVITVYDLNGRLVGQATAEGTTTSIATSLRAGQTAIVRIGERGVKVLLK